MEAAWCIPVPTDIDSSLIGLKKTQFHESYLAGGQLTFILYCGLSQFIGEQLNKAKVETIYITFHYHSITHILYMIYRFNQFVTLSATPSNLLVKKK